MICGMCKKVSRIPAVRFSAVLLGLLIHAVPLLAQGVVVNDPDDFLGDFESRVWTSADGLPGNTITDLMQDTTGYLYIGTYGGLVRFDGVEFLTMNRSVNSRYDFVSARSIFQDKFGNIWVGSNDEGVACIAPNRSVRMFTVQDGLPNNSVRAVCEDQEGNIWVGTAGGVAYIEHGVGKILRPAGLEQYNEESIIVSSLYCDTAGRMWVTGSSPGSIYLYSKGSFSRYTGIQSLKDPVVNIVAQDSRGTFWFGASPHYAVRIDSGGERLYDLGHGNQPGTIVNAILQDKNGNLWFGLDSGVAIMHNGELSFYDQKDGLTDNNIKTILEDREGNIWLATDRGGVEKLSLSKFKTISMPTTVNAIAQSPDGELVWLGADDGLYCLDQKGALQKNAATDFCRGVRVRHVGFTSAGDLLVSTYEKFGQILFRKDGSIAYWTKDSGLTGNKVRVVVERSNGDLYVGTTNGLNVINPASGQIRTFTRENGLPHEYIMCIFEDSAGTMWFGTDGGGVFSMNDDKVETVYTTADGLVGNVIFKISELQPGELWICTGTGISRIRNGTIESFTASDGLRTDGIFQVLTDYTGKIWMTSNLGISSAKLSDFDDFVSGRSKSINVKFFSRSDGIHSGGVTSTSLSLKDNLGRIWFTMIDGVAVYDPVKITMGDSAPAVQIQDVAVDDEICEYTASTVVLAPEAKRLTIKFTGMSFISPEQMQFRYMLDGFDSGLSQWSTSRSVSYTNLPPGRYSFKVQAMNNNDVESELSESLFVIKRPYFWQLWYFWVLMSLLVLSLVGLVIYGRYRRLKRYQLLLEEEVERKTSELKQKAHDLELEKSKSEQLLLNILPQPVAEELTASPDKVIADQYEQVTVLFADIVGFTKMSSGMRAADIVRMLNSLFSKFDRRALEEHVEKIKTIGDAYMAACGLDDHADAQACADQMIRFAFGMFRDLEEFNRNSFIKLKMRVGINTGPLVAGVIGRSKFIYDIWGDTVNVASRMESSGIAERIHVTEATRNLAGQRFDFEGPVEIEVKGKGMMKTYFVKVY